MQPDVVCRAEDLPFADGELRPRRLPARRRTTSTTSRAAVREMARVAARRVADRRHALHAARTLEEAEKLRDPSHVRNYTDEEWRGFVEDAGPAASTTCASLPQRRRVRAWLARAGCEGEEAERVRELVGDRVDGRPADARPIALKAVKA